MASSRVMQSSLTANSDLACEPSVYSLTMSGDQAKNLGSMSMDDLLRNIYGDGTAAAAASSPATPFGGDAEEAAAPPLLAREGSSSLPRSIGSKTVEEVWREISGGKKADGGGDGPGYKDATAAAATAAYGEMTLEDFLARTGAVREEDVRVPLGSAASGGFGVDAMMNDRFGQQQAQLPLENPMLGFGNGVEAGGGGGGRGGRGRKRPVLDPVDRAALQRQKRMIKNRESAARSRERKQAYTVELEAIVTQLEEENARLLGEQEEVHSQRLKQLRENLIPVTEKKQPPRALRRTHSM
ncbi:bZIP transcription factor 12-like [Phoenix dactylifera]|uniref:BZIP transcription factor 12-like n=1 Tax=Phoenix dactylifera TaxID=42345 RepID=A0A8B7MSN1_PHODC|nr:bZIP transcription factor 12-like [Phoenix dactylifera]